MDLMARLPSRATEAENTLNGCVWMELDRKFADHKKDTYITGNGWPPPEPKLYAADYLQKKVDCDIQIYEFDSANGSFIEYHDNEIENKFEFLHFFIIVLVLLYALNIWVF